MKQLHVRVAALAAFVLILSALVPGVLAYFFGTKIADMQLGSQLISTLETTTELMESKRIAPHVGEQIFNSDQSDCIVFDSLDSISLTQDQEKNPFS
jgi:hypothetical protein